MCHCVARVLTPAVPLCRVVPARVLQLLELEKARAREEAQKRRPRRKRSGKAAKAPGEV